MSFTTAAPAPTIAHAPPFVRRDTTAHSEECPFSDLYVSAKMGPRSDMRELTDYAIMIDAAHCIEDRVVTDHRIRLDDRP